MTDDLTQLIHETRELVEDLDYSAARRWLEQNPGGKVLGHFQVYFPEELAHAAGMLPIKLCSTFLFSFVHAAININAAT